jgi:predicted acyl esterase
MWLSRLARTPFFLEEWLRHQRRDEFWRQGSICEDFAALRAPTLLVGGWADGYTNPVGRTLEGLVSAGVPCRALLGPWSHGWPHVSNPGPRIGFLQECLRWWDHWLKGVDNGAMDVPLLRVWMQEYDPPAAFHSQRSGRWTSEDKWPPRSVQLSALYPTLGGTLADAPGLGGRESHVASELSGSDAGAWCPYGEETDFPPDQRAEDGLALAYTTAPLQEPMQVLGYPRVTLSVQVDKPWALVAVRLCDVAPDGSSLLVARGLLNLSHRASHVDVEPMAVGEATEILVDLDLTGHVFAAGHRVRLAVSAGYWPFAWPSPEAAELALLLGERTRLDVPVRAYDSGELPAFLGPATSPPAVGTVEHSAWRIARRDLADGQVLLETGDEDRSTLDDSRLEFGQRAARRYAVRHGDPLSARTECEGVHFLRREGWDVQVQLRTSMAADARAFRVTKWLEAREGDTVVYSDATDVEIPRDGV